MPWVIEPISSIARYHERREAIEQRLAWPLACNVTWATPRAVVISGLRGDGMDRTKRQELRDELFSLGVRQVLYERHGRLVPVDIDSEEWGMP